MQRLQPNKTNKKMTPNKDKNGKVINETRFS